jgi:hypothetical protein
LHSTFSPVVDCDAAPGTVVAAFRLSGGNGNPVTLSLTGPNATDFAINGTKVVVARTAWRRRIAARCEPSPLPRASHEGGERAFTEALGVRRRAAHEAKGLRRKQLGLASQIWFSQICGSERGQRDLTVDAMLRFAAILSVPPASLIRPN